MQRVPPVLFPGTLWLSGPYATSLPALSPTFAGSCPSERACPVSCPQSQHLGRAWRCPLQPNPARTQPGAIPCLPLLRFLLLCQAGLAASTAGVLPAPACPHHGRLPPQLSPAACRWMRGTASATRCGGTTTKESPSAGPSSTAAAGATSTASTARRSVSCTAGSAQGQVGTARHGMATGLAASPSGAVGSADTEPKGRCWSPASALTPPHFSPQMPAALPAARWEGRQRRRRRQCLGRQGCPVVGVQLPPWLGLGCPRRQGRRACQPPAGTWCYF